MYARVRELLTPEERLQYLQIPTDLSEWELGTYFSFTQHDLDVIQRRRRDHNRIGFAVQLCILRYLGWTLSEVKDIPAKVLQYVAKQVNVAAVHFLLIVNERPRNTSIWRKLGKNMAIRRLPCVSIDPCASIFFPRQW